MTQKEYSFSERIGWMLEARKLLDKEFYPYMAHNSQFVQFGGSQASVSVQRDQHVDVAFQPSERYMALQHGSADTSLTVDEKIDSKRRPTIFAEEWSKKDTVLGWIQPGVSKADLLLYAWVTKRPVGLLICLLKMPEFIQWYWENNTKFESYDIPNREAGASWVTVGRGVDRRSIPEAIYVMYEYQVYAGMHERGDQLSLWTDADFFEKPGANGAYSDERH